MDNIILLAGVGAVFFHKQSELLLRIFCPEWKFSIPSSRMSYSIYILHPAEDSRALVGLEPYVKVYTAIKTKLRIQSHALAETFWSLL